MKLTDVVVASDMNPLYSDFIPIFCKAWKAIFPDIVLHVILISDKIPDHLEQYREHIVLFPPLKGIKNGFIAQFIRLLYPAICKGAKGGILTTDIDMIPLYDEYYTKYIEGIEDNRFIVYRKPFVWQNKQQYPICYNVAHSETWGEIFKISSKEDIVERLKIEYAKISYHGNPGAAGWFTDQAVLHDELMSWYSKRPHIIILGDGMTKFQRLDRIFKPKMIPKLVEHISSHFYCDYHMLRPYKDHKEVNDAICDLLEEIYGFKLGTIHK